MLLVSTACTASTTSDAEPITEPNDTAAKSRLVDTSIASLPKTTAPPALDVPGQPQWSEDFTGDTGLDGFRTGVYHRDDELVTEETWPADHDLDCGPPTTSRTVHRDVPAESFYNCRDHLMTAVGDTSGYSIAWFSPEQTFEEAEEVCWSVNLTDLGSRKWWKVAVLSVDAPDIMSEVAASELSGIAGPDRAVASWGGVGGYNGKLRIGQERMDWWFMSAGTDRMTRYPACFRDNGDNTLTFTMTGPKDGQDTVQTDSFTVAGKFPSGPKKVVFQDHSYTPSKSDNGVGGVPFSYTFHWDDLSVD